MLKRGSMVVGLGEALFDVFAVREVLGGAPLNVAVHAHQMSAAGGGEGIPASRIGADALGRRLIDELTARGVPTCALQVDPDRPTGRVLVTLDRGEPAYEIVEETAWDALEFTTGWQSLATECDAVCFGTLGQRSAASRAAIGAFLRTARQAIRLFDVNLRQHYYSADLIRESCALATVVKLNESELPEIHRLAGTAAAGTPDEQAAGLREQFHLTAVVLTRGAAGTTLYTAEGKTTGEPVAFPRRPDADSVGAGDACAAGVVIGMIQGWPAERIVRLANAAGAFVASQPGATPRLSQALLDEVSREPAGPGPHDTEDQPR